MIEIVRLLTRNPHLFKAFADEAELCAARAHLQNALHVLERTLQSMDGDPTEPSCANAISQEQS